MCQPGGPSFTSGHSGLRADFPFPALRPSIDESWKFAAPSHQLRRAESQGPSGNRGQLSRSPVGHAHCCVWWQDPPRAGSCSSAVLMNLSDGVWLFELAAVSDIRRRCPTRGGGVGITNTGQDRERSRWPPRGCRWCWCFDNCEHVLDAAGISSKRSLSHSAPRKCLATVANGLGVAASICACAPR